MANLSNINNKLIVTDGGNLLVNATANLATYGGITIDNFSDPSIAMKTTSTSGWLWTQYITSSGTTNFSMGVNQTIPYWCVKAGAGMDSPHLVVDAAGEVGIGTTGPLTKLDVRGSTFVSGYLAGFDTTPQGNYAYRLTNDSANSFINVLGGNLGIGTASPGAKLDIKGDGAVSGLTFRTTDSSNNETFYINDGGTVGVRYYPFKIGVASGTTNVANSRFQIATTGGDFVVLNDGKTGIGITSPSKLLHLLGADATVQIQGSGTSSNAGVDFFPRDISNVAHLQSIKGVSSNLTFLTGGNSGNSYVPTERMRIDSGGSVIIGAGPTSGTPSADYRSLEIGRQGNTITGAPWKSNLYFSTNATITAGSTTFTARYLNELPMQYVMEDGIFTWSNAVAPTAVGNTVSFNERMRINAAGDVGIFVTNPGARLEVKAGTTYASNTDLGIKITNAGYRGSELNTFGEGSYLTHYFENYTGGSGRAYDRALEIVCKGSPDGTYGEGIIKFKANPITAGSNVAEIMRITGSGKVGIGTDSPSAKLHVMGTTGLPATSGTTFTGTMRLQVAGGYGTVMDFGAVGPSTGTQWIQVTDASNQALHYPLLLQPNGGTVGIGTTTPYSLLDVNGVITNRAADADPNFTVAVVGMSKIEGGSLQFTQGFAGTSSVGDTVVFRYNATAWKSWSLDYTFAGANMGLVKGTIGGYNNNSGGGTNAFLSNTIGATVSVANSGQNVIVTFTGNFGIHMMCDMRYSQGGGDGAPRADRASLTYNS